MIIAQLTDCHILPPPRRLFGRVDTAHRLTQAVDWLNALRPRPDIVLVTGDLVDFADAEAYALLRRLLAPLAMPVFVIPGNHDDRALLRATFADHAYLPAAGFLHYAIEDRPIRLIGVDTLVPGHAYGALDAERIGWLAATLAARPDVPTLLFMHHPPFMTGIEQLDLIACRGADRLAAVLAEHPQVEAILCGHHHQAITTRWKGIVASVAPPTAQPLALDIAGDNPPTWMMEPPAASLHVWRRGAGLVSRTVCVERFPGPFAYARSAEERGLA